MIQTFLDKIERTYTRATNQPGDKQLPGLGKDGDQEALSVGERVEPGIRQPGVDTKTVALGNGVIALDQVHADVVLSAEDGAPANGIDQAAEVGYEMVNFSFGSGFNPENESEENNQISGVPEIDHCMCDRVPNMY